MPKKRVSEERTGESKAIPKEKYEELQEKIVENLVELQKVHTNLAEKFDKLSDQITSLLRLFEMAAKSFASTPGNMVGEKDKDFLEKVDKLLEQNKTIAKGLMIIEEKVRERMYGVPAPNPGPVTNYNSQQAFAQNVPTTGQTSPGQTVEEQPQEDSAQPSLMSRPLPRL